MDPIAAQQPDPQGPRRSRLGRGVLATGAAVVALGVGAVGASAGGSSDAGSDGSATDTSAPGFVQETTPEAPAEPRQRGDEPCPEKDGAGGSQEGEGSGGAAQTPDASDAALYQ